MSLFYSILFFDFLRTRTSLYDAIYQLNIEP